ncbi:MAG: phosphoglycerate dehydrogenase [Thermoleophilia bacterium]|nr:phosphoglycerate dehydrogenase [Thermoleophilia bacterium]
MTATSPASEAQAVPAGERPRVLVAEELAPAGIAALEARTDVTHGAGWSLEELTERISEFDGIVVRSATKVNAALIEAGTNLRVVGRAGVGVDNVDLDAASARGIIVVNAPTSNVLSVAEHTLGLTLALARNVARGDATLRAGTWQRSQLGGIELSGRTLVLLGMGRIGQLVAERARSFGMRVVGYDPFVSVERMRGLGIERAETIDEALEQADVLSLHMPLTPDTRGLIGAAQLAKLPDGALLVNTARGPLVDLDALDAALVEGRIGGAALDVFPTEPPPFDHPLFTRDNVLVTPHLAASTEEAQNRAGEQVAEQVVAALVGGVVTSAVNVPAIGPEDLEALQPWVPLVARLTRLADQLADGAPTGLRVEACGEIAAYDVRMLSTGALVGLLSGATEDSVNVVNAPHIAESRGIKVEATTDAAAKTFRSLVVVNVDGDHSSAEVVGTVIGANDRPWLTHILGHSIDIELVPYMAFFEYSDVPGVVGKVGSALGAAGVNIANMAVARSGTDSALMAVSFDEAPAPGVLEAITAQGEFTLAKLVSLA